MSITLRRVLPSLSSAVRQIARSMGVTVETTKPGDGEIGVLA